MRTRIIAFIFLFGAVILTAQQDSVKVSPTDVIVSYTCVNKTLDLVLSDLVKKSKVNIVFSQAKINKRRRVKIAADQEKLGRLLAVILKPYKLDYNVVGDNIVIVSMRSRDYRKSITLSGYIKDQETGETLPYATIYDNGEGVGTVANENGFYSITIPSKDYNFEVSYIGYETIRMEDFYDDDKSNNLYLNSDNTLNEVLVSSTENQEEGSVIGRERFDKTNLNHATFLGGESDITQLINLSSGVSSGADGFGGLSVRGGTYDQNQVLYDGVPMHHTGHALGLVSIFNSNIIQEATLYKSNYPSKYGGKLSSILDIRTREGNYKKFSGEVGLSTLASKVTLEGPIVKDKASFIISARRTFADVWIKALSDYQNNINGNEGQASYSFYDINAKVNAQLGSRNKILLSYYKGNDDFNNFTDAVAEVESSRFEDNARNEINWGSDLMTLHLNTILSKKAFSRLMLFRTTWNYDAYNHDGFYIDRDTSKSEIYNSSYEGSKISTIGARYEVDYIKSSQFQMSFGIGANMQQFDPKAIFRNNLNNGEIYPQILTKEELINNAGNASLSSLEYLGFFEGDYKFSKYTSIKFGAHASYYSVLNKDYLSVQPRISFLTGDGASTVKVSISQMRQYNHILSNNQLGFPSDLWVTSTERLKPADSWQGSIGTLFNIDKTFDINAEVYYKIQNNIVALGEGQSVPFDQEGVIWENTIPRGDGTSYGFELDVIKRFGRSTFNFNYTYSRSTREFPDLNNGIVFDYRYDRPHMFNGTFRTSLGEKADVSLNFIYSKGNPVTKPTSEIIEVANGEGEKFLSIVYQSKNNYRLRDYVRLDLGFNFYSEYSFGKQKFFLGVYNLMNNQNPLYLDVRRNKFDPSVFELHSVSVLPILPAINYSLIF